MPLYEYHCEECQESFELFVRSLRAPVNAVCPKCGSAHVEKEITAASALGVRRSASFALPASSCAPSG